MIIAQGPEQIRTKAGLQSRQLRHFTQAGFSPFRSTTALWQVKQNPACTCLVSTKGELVNMLVFNSVPSGSFPTVLSYR